MDIEYHYQLDVYDEMREELYDAYMRHDYNDFYYNMVAIVVCALIDGDIL